VEAADTSDPQALCRAYAAWRGLTLAGAIVATAVGLVVHGPMGEVRFDFEGERPPPWLLFKLVVLVVGAFGPGLVGAGLALAAIWSWRRLRTSSRLARAAWILWVLGPLPILLLPVARLFDLNLEDSLKTSVKQVGYLLTVTAPALFALLPGTLRAALVLERFLPESRAPGQITLLAAPACAVAYLLPLAVLTQPAAPCQFAPRPAAGGPLASSPRYAEPGRPSRSNHRRGPGSAGRLRRGADRRTAGGASSAAGLAWPDPRHLGAGFGCEGAGQQVVDGSRRDRLDGIDVAPKPGVGTISGGHGGGGGPRSEARRPGPFAAAGWAYEGLGRIPA
jgi:hypothetical protein